LLQLSRIAFDNTISQLSAIPSHFFGSNFAAFFRWSVLQNESLPIGIYRAPNLILGSKLP
jgi:hypothetical protein